MSTAIGQAPAKGAVRPIVGRPAFVSSVGWVRFGKSHSRTGPKEAPAADRSLAAGPSL